MVGSSDNKLASRVLVGIASLVVAIGVTLAASWGRAKYEESQQKAEQIKREEAEAQAQAIFKGRAAKVRIMVRFDPTICPVDAIKSNLGRFSSYPLVVSIVNGADRAILNTSFFVNAHDPNYSDSLYRTDASVLELPLLQTDRIVKPGEEWVACFDVLKPLRDASTIVWSMENGSVRFSDS